MDPHSLFALCTLRQGGVLSSLTGRVTFLSEPLHLLGVGTDLAEAVKVFSTKIAALALSDTDLCLGMFREGRWAERRGRREASVSLSKSRICVVPLLDHLGKISHSPNLMITWICDPPGGSGGSRDTCWGTIPWEQGCHPSQVMVKPLSNAFLWFPLGKTSSAFQYCLGAWGNGFETDWSTECHWSALLGWLFPEKLQEMRLSCYVML